MALGTPVAAAVAYSGAGGTSVSPAYPASIATTDAVLLIVGQKPSTANGGTVTTPSGWTLRAQITGAGGYGTTLGADTGNTNLRIYSWDNPVAGQTGNLSVTIGTNNVSWAFMVRIPSGGGTLTYGSATGSRTTAPTAGTPFSVTLTDGSPTTAFQTGDVALWAMCIPTDVTTPSQFSGHDITATGAVFGTPIELNEPDSGTGNDIGGYSAWDNVDSGSSTVAPTITVTAGGTVTNVRGPFALVRVRELAAIDLDAQPGSFSIAGQDAELVYTRKLSLDAQPASFTLTGEPAELIKTAQRDLDAQPGSFNYTGQDATLTYVRAFSLDAQPASFTLTGQPAELVYTRALSLDAQPASFTIAGQAAELVYTRKLSLDAQPAAFTVTGQDATLDFVQARTLDATAGTFTISGAAATLTRTRVFAADAGAFVLTGQDAELTQQLLLNAEAGSFATVGQDATLVYVRNDVVLDAQPAAFTISGAAATLTRTRVFAANAGAFVLTGQDAELTQQLLLNAEAGSFATVGQDATLVYVRNDVVLDAQPAAFTITGQDASFPWQHILNAQPGAFYVSEYVDTGYVDPGYVGGPDSGLLWGRVFVANAGDFSISGQDAVLRVGTPYPDPSDVREGVLYGPGGIYVGTYRGSKQMYLFDD